MPAASAPSLEIGRALEHLRQVLDEDPDRLQREALADRVAGLAHDCFDRVRERVHPPTHTQRTAHAAFYRRSTHRGTAADARTGSVTFVQRFGSAGNLNLHFHILVIDGVFTEGPDHSLKFHPAEAPTDEAIAQLLATIRPRVLRHVARCGPSEDVAESADRLRAEAPLLAACYASSIGQRRTLGARAGAPLERLGAGRSAPRVERRGRQQAHLDGFDLHAALRVAAQLPEGRAPLEKLLKYCARPPIVHDRLSELPDGRIALRLKTPWSDGSTHVVYEPLDLIAKLAALIPRPHKNLVLYHGVLAANSSWRSRAVRYGRSAEREPAAPAAADPPSMRPRRAQWAELMRYAFAAQAQLFDEPVL